jgi:hypothetical protein
VIDTATIIVTPPALVTPVITPPVSFVVSIPEHDLSGVRTVVVTPPANVSPVILPPPVYVLELVAKQGISGPPGVEGPRGVPGGASLDRVSAVDLSGHRAVYVNNTGSVDYASNTLVSNAPRVIGMTSGASSTGLPSNIVTAGETSEPSWNWSLDLPIYLGADGFLTQVVPALPLAKFLLVMGFPISATTIFIHIGNPIFLTI